MGPQYIFDVKTLRVVWSLGSHIVVQKILRKCDFDLFVTFVVLISEQEENVRVVLKDGSPLKRINWKTKLNSGAAHSGHAIERNFCGLPIADIEDFVN